MGHVHRLDRAPESLLKLATKKIAVASGLSLLFIVVYGGCNWITARRHDVGVFFFEWERGIAFVPALILPYLSIDLFFVGAPFLLHSERDLKIFATRVAAAILTAGVFFLAFPLRFAFHRPHAGGWTGALFNAFLRLDAPFNLFPSLHAALWVLLVDVYARRLRRRSLWWLTMSWFALIAVSPLLTHQHHVLDIAGGLLLGLACLALIGRSFRSPTGSA